MERRYVKEKLENLTNENLIPNMYADLSKVQATFKTLSDISIWRIWLNRTF